MTFLTFVHVVNVVHFSLVTDVVAHWLYNFRNIFIFILSSNDLHINQCYFLWYFPFQKKKKKDTEICYFVVRKLNLIDKIERPNKYKFIETYKKMTQLYSHVWDVTIVSQVPIKDETRGRPQFCHVILSYHVILIGPTKRISIERHNWTAHSTSTSTR